MLSVWLGVLSSILVWFGGAAYVRRLKPPFLGGIGRMCGKILRYHEEMCGCKQAVAEALDGQRPQKGVQSFHDRTKQPPFSGRNRNGWLVRQTRQEQDGYHPEHKIPPLCSWAVLLRCWFVFFVA